MSHNPAILAWRRRRAAVDHRGRRALRPSVTTLEGRALLATFTVSSSADDGSQGTLRWAINQANGDNEPDTINFSDLFAMPQIITLTGSQLNLTDAATTTIIGPGANLLTVSGNTASRVFAVYGSAQISGLTITGGRAEQGGGILNAGELTLTGCAVSGNSASSTGYGGGLFNRGAAVALSNCTVSGTSPNPPAPLRH